MRQIRLIMLMLQFNSTSRYLADLLDVDNVFFVVFFFVFLLVFGERDLS